MIARKAKRRELRIDKIEGFKNPPGSGHRWAGGWHPSLNINPAPLTNCESNDNLALQGILWYIYNNMAYYMITTIIDKGGRLVIPAKYRKALGMKPGNEVLLMLEDSGIRIVSKQQAIAQAQAEVRRYIPKGRSLSEELIMERREEASRG
jgi:AbrB family looped-hinge helix DNA binding protein